MSIVIITKLTARLSEHVLKAANMKLEIAYDPALPIKGEDLDGFVHRLIERLLQVHAAYGKCSIEAEAIIQSEGYVVEEPED